MGWRGAKEGCGREVEEEDVCAEHAVGLVVAASRLQGERYQTLSRLICTIHTSACSSSSQACGMQRAAHALIH